MLLWQTSQSNTLQKHQVKGLVAILTSNFRKRKKSRRGAIKLSRAVGHCFFSSPSQKSCVWIPAVCSGGSWARSWRWTLPNWGFRSHRRHRHWDHCWWSCSRPTWNKQRKVCHLAKKCSCRANYYTVNSGNLKAAGSSSVGLKKSWQATDPSAVGVTTRTSKQVVPTDFNSYNQTSHVTPV